MPIVFKATYLNVTELLFNSLKRQKIIDLKEKIDIFIAISPPLLLGWQCIRTLI
jgi:hypothetical protein